MPDLGKVIYSIERCVCHVPDACRDCYYDELPAPECIDHLMRDAHALLKAQEPVKAISDGEDSYMCNNCGTVIGWAEWEPGGIEEVKYKFCPECGKAVKWE